MKKDILDYLDSHNVSYSQLSKLSEVAKESDVLCLNRLQKERLKGMKAKFDENGVKLTKDILSSLNKKSIITHILPRTSDFNELPEEFDSDSRIVIFDQVANGLYIRMALLNLLLNHG